MDFWAKFPSVMTKIGPKRAKNHKFSNGKKKFAHRQKLDFTMNSKLKIFSLYGTFEKKLPF